MQLLAAEGYLVEGFDSDSICVDMSSKYGPCKKGDIADLISYYPEGHFDIVISLHVIEHLDSPKKCLEQFMRLSNQYILLATPNLSSLPFLNLRRSVSPCNVGHVCGWNFSHLKNLLENILCVSIVEWMPDCVRLYSYLPRMGWLDSFFHKSGLRFLFEEKILKWVFPNLSNSLIVLAKIPI